MSLYREDDEEWDVEGGMKVIDELVAENGDGKSKKILPKYKIDFYKAEKIEIHEAKCGNCGATHKEMYACKYAIKEYDEFSKKVVDKVKSTRVCGKCKWYIQKVLLPIKTEKALKEKQAKSNEKK